MGLRESAELLGRAEALYEALSLRPPQLGAAFLRAPFRRGGIWMKRVLRKLGSAPRGKSGLSLQRLGSLKYGAAFFVSLSVLLFPLQPALALLTGALLFYLVEVQMVFLFPLVLEGSEDPWRESFRRTRQAGGTFPVLGRVLVVAFYMVTGGIFRWGLRRSWCVGCLAVLVWYLDLKEGKTHGLA